MLPLDELPLDDEVVLSSDEVSPDDSSPSGASSSPEPEPLGSPSDGPASGVEGFGSVLSVPLPSFLGLVDGLVRFAHLCLLGVVRLYQAQGLTPLHLAHQAARVDSPFPAHGELL